MVTKYHTHRIQHLYSIKIKNSKVQSKLKRLDLHPVYKHVTKVKSCLFIIFL